MIKGHSLLYSIYICLIVSIMCGALLYFSSLYTQLNLYYNLHEELYINNLSTVNYALGSKMILDEVPQDENSEIKTFYETKQHGLLSLLLAKSSIKNDTVASAYFVGNFNTDKTAIHLANFSKPLSFSGIVKLAGDNKLPSINIETVYINNKPNQITIDGKKVISEILLPEINSNFKKMFEAINTNKIDLTNVDKIKDSLYLNSFFNETKEINVNSVLNNVIFKGNFILRSRDSIRIRKNCILEDIILIAPKITFEEGFNGTVQAFASKGIELEQKTVLNYPSIVCIYNTSIDDSFITIKNECKIIGAIALFGSRIENIDKNSIEIDEKSLIYADIYCSGKLFLKSNVCGSVYTNRFFYKTQSSIYDNIIADIEINVLKRPKYFIAIPLFDTKKTEYGILKKVL